MTPTLRRRYQRLLAAYPRDWRAANGEVVLGTLLEAAGDQRRWPPLREAAALLRGGVRARARQAALDPPRRRVVEGLQLGAILLAVTALSVVVYRTVSLIAHGIAEWDTGLSLTLEVVGTAILLLVALAVVRGRVLLGLLVVVLSVPINVAIPLVLQAAGQAGLPHNPAELVVETVLGALPLLGVLGVLVKTGGARRRSWAWLLLPLALGLIQAFAWMRAWTIADSLTLVLMVAALLVAALTGEIRPAVALAVYGLPDLLMILDGAVRFGADQAWTGTLDSTPGALAGALALTAWVTVRMRRRRAQRAAPSGPTSREDA
jgi:hypothetical protein